MPVEGSAVNMQAGSEIQDAIIRGYDGKGRPIAAITSAHRDTSIHEPYDPDADPTTPEGWEAMVRRPELHGIIGHGRSDGGTHKKAKPRRLTQTRKLGGEGFQAVRFRTRISYGAALRYNRRPGRAAEVLDNLARFIAEGGIPEVQAIRRRGKRPLKTFEVYGLNEAQAKELKRFPGTAGWALMEDARAHDPSILRSYDGDDEQ